MKTYYWLSKPGIIYGNCLMTASAFLFASILIGRFNIWLFLATLAGIALVIGCGCVINNYIDRDIDKLMSRTNKRAMVAGIITVKLAISYGIILGIIGFAILAAFTNFLTLAVGFTGLFFYLVMYSIGKRRTVYGTIIGSVSGAMPIVAGYTAVTNQIDSAALILFLIMVSWQMPHFYAIAIYRLKDYQAAGLPVWPAVRGIATTKRQIVAFILAFVMANSLMTAFGYTGYVYLIVMNLFCIWWLSKALPGINLRKTDTNFKKNDISLHISDVSWAKGMFLFSLIVLSVLSIMLPVGALLP